MQMAPPKPLTEAEGDTVVSEEREDQIEFFNRQQFDVDLIWEVH